MRGTALVARMKLPSNMAAPGRKTTGTANKKRCYKHKCRSSDKWGAVRGSSFPECENMKLSKTTSFCCFMVIFTPTFLCHKTKVASERAFGVVLLFCAREEYVGILHCCYSVAFIQLHSGAKWRES